MKSLAYIRSMLMSDVPSPEQRQQILRMAMEYMKESYEVKDDYLMAMLFPEFSPNVRIPSPFGLPSTLHTYKQEAYLTTSASGEGTLIFTLADLHYNLVYSTAKVVTGSSGMGNFTIDNYTEPLYTPKIYDYTYLHDYFSHCRVVGASVRISYIGQHDEEQGFMVGSQIFNQYIPGITDRDIEEGYHVKRVRPHEGIRLAYTPSDERDFEFTEMNFRVVTRQGVYYTNWPASSTPYAGTPCVQLLPYDLMYMSVSPTNNPSSGDAIAYTNALQVYMRSLYRGTTSNTDPTSDENAYIITTLNTSESLAWVNVSHLESNSYGIPHLPYIGPANFLGLAAKAGQFTNMTPQIAAVYYKGLPKNEQCLRVDIVRHLECIPRQEKRQFMTLARPQYCDHTQKLAAQIQHKQSKLQVSSLIEAPHVAASTSVVLHNTRTPDEVMDRITHVDTPGVIQTRAQGSDRIIYDYTLQQSQHDFMGTVGGYLGTGLGAMIGGGPLGASIGGALGSAAGMMYSAYKTPAAESSTTAYTYSSYVGNAGTRGRLLPITY